MRCAFCANWDGLISLARRLAQILNIEVGRRDNETTRFQTKQ